MDLVLNNLRRLICHKNQSTHSDVISVNDLGTTEKKCSRPSFGKRCGKNRTDHMECEQPQNYTKYKQNHPADSKKCEVWKKEYQK